MGKASMAQPSMGELSEEERLALIDAGEMDDPEGEEDEGGTDAGDEGEDAGGDDAGGDDAGEDRGEVGDGPAGEGAEGATAAGDAGDDVAGDSQPNPHAGPDVSNLIFEVDTERLSTAKARRDEIKAERANLKQQLDDGALAMDDWMERVEALNSEYAELAAEISTADAQLRHNNDLPEKLWKSAQRAFMGVADNKQFHESVDPVMFAALNGAIMHLSRQPEWSGQFIDYQALLETAKAQVLERMGKAEAPAPAPDGKKAVRDKRKELHDKADARRKQAPQTLSDLPASDPNSEDTGGEDPEFARLDRLIDEGNVMAYESMLARMPESKADEYLIGRRG